MVKTCSAPYCSERAKKNAAITFHRFPKEDYKRKQWETALRRPNFKANASCCLCSKHFPEECFYTTMQGKRYLKNDAIPTLFDFPKSLKSPQAFRDPKLRSAMAQSCCVKGCKTVFKKGGDVSFHKFPKDEVHCKLWVAQLKRENFIVKESTKICSRHFKEECFDRSKFGGTWLKKDAIPTIFNLCNCPKKQTLRKQSIPQVKLDIVPPSSNVLGVQNQVTVGTVYPSSNILNAQNQVEVETILPSLNIPSFQNQVTVDTIPTSLNVSNVQNQVKVETILPTLNIPSFQNQLKADTVPASSNILSVQNQGKEETILPSSNFSSFQNQGKEETILPSSNFSSFQNQVETILPEPSPHISSFQNQGRMDTVPSSSSVQNQAVKEEVVSLSESESSPLEEQMVVAPASQNQDDGVIKREKRKYYLGDFDENDMHSPSKAKQVLALAKARDEVYKKEIKNLRKKNKLMSRKIKSLKKIMSDVVSKKLKEGRKVSNKGRDRTSQCIDDMAEEIAVIIDDLSPSTSDCEADSFRLCPDEKAQRSTASRHSSSVSTSDKHKAPEIQTDSGQSQWQPVDCSNGGPKSFIKNAVKTRENTTD